MQLGLADGMPCGIQLVASPGQDPLLLATAYAFERVAPAVPEWSPR
jgi:Asp-tRNA(Asn)/Glu-tRNA(Gln) amidotransferase A subunit family amidase